MPSTRDPVGLFRKPRRRHRAGRHRQFFNLRALHSRLLCRVLTRHYDPIVVTASGRHHHVF